MRCAVGGEDSQVVEANVGQMRVASGKAGETGVIPEVADKGVLMIVIHVGDDALFRCFICAFGSFVPHDGLLEWLNGGRRMEQRLGNQVVELTRRGVCMSFTVEIVLSRRGKLSFDTPSLQPKFNTRK